MKKFKQFLEYAMLRAIELFLCSLPLAWALKGGEVLGLLMSKILKKRQRLIVDNLSRAFPEKSDVEIQSIARQNWKNLGRTALEFVRSQDYLTPSAAARVQWEGVEQVEAAFEKQRGVIMISFHFTNWEILGMLFQQRYKRMMAIARPIKNPFVESWIQRKRTQGGMKITLHREAVKASLRWLNAKNLVGILVDQNLYQGGVFVNFFGRPAATTTLPALLTIRTGAPVFITYTLRDAGTFRAIFKQVVFPNVDDEERRVIVYTQTINNGLEQIIRRHPENWFWIHNRWKRQPESVSAT